MVARVFSRLGAASLEVSADVEGAITGFIEDAVTAIGRWIVGDVLVASTPMQLIAIAAILTGNTSGGARIVGGTLWLAGPAGTLIALVSEGIASLGSRERRISDDEYDWANNTIFGGRLPPRERIVITDTRGGGGRSFAYPRFDGRITINLGELYENPQSSPSLFAHELTHAWQLGNTMGDVDFITSGIGVRVCELLGIDPYAIPADTPFRDLNMEAQAQVVQIWVVENGGVDHRYYHYIAENIRTGMA